MVATFRWFLSASKVQSPPNGRWIASLFGQYLTSAAPQLPTHKTSKALKSVCPLRLGDSFQSKNCEAYDYGDMRKRLKLKISEVMVALIVKGIKM